MSLMHVTLTGVDASTDLSKLWRISKLYPMVEWGLLVSKKVRGPRYLPWRQLNEIMEFLDTFPSIKASIHLCDGVADDAIKCQDNGLLATLAEFSRIQLNFNHTLKGSEMTQLNGFIQHCAMMKSGVDRIVITQHNEMNKALSGRIFHTHHQPLIDASQGRGIEITNFDYQTTKTACGYAGGLSNENIPRLLPKMFAAANGRPFWIDMESSLRTDDLFDLEKAEQILRTVERVVDLCTLPHFRQPSPS